MKVLVGSTEYIVIEADPNKDLGLIIPSRGRRRRKCSLMLGTCFTRTRTWDLRDYLKTTKIAKTRTKIN